MSLVRETLPKSQPCLKVPFRTYGSICNLVQPFKKREASPLFKGMTNIHFIGIGGIGMSGIAELLLLSGCRISGSDQGSGPIIERLRELGARIEMGHHAGHLGEAQVIVYSSAIGPDNPERVAGRERGLPTIQRAEMLAELMRGKEGITVTGTHGKTTTTAMLAWIMIGAGLDPTVVVGARVPELGGNARLGNSKFLVAEADESDRSLLRYFPLYTIITNVDLDHLDEYRDLEDLKETFLQHLHGLPFYGCAVLCADDPHLQSLRGKVQRRVITYGLEQPADLSAADVRLEGFQSSFQVFQGGIPVGRMRLQVPGRHNVLNALAALALGRELGVPFSTAAQALQQFRGAERRLQWKGEKKGVRVLDDYGHHPTEIRAALSAVRTLNHRILLVFQPHRFSRTAGLMDELARCFDGADELYLMDVYAAGEVPIEGADSGELMRRIRRYRPVEYFPSRQELLRRLRRRARRGDLILTMGAGDVWKIGEAFLEHEE